ncbi:hypothetical protein FQN54_000920 [Arachnomyces sp. PD_36]|nr:hypothetical protein FQN54_000920 [Arachnomyces sp. PD_36]
MTRRSNASSRLETDVILPMQDPYMDQIIDGTKNYEFRKYRLKPSVKRIWFYRTAPHSSITHICEILPARTRDAGDPPLEENGLGNEEYNSRDKEYEGYDFAYKIVSVYAIKKPLSLLNMRESHGFKSAPRGLVYLPNSINQHIDWRGQKKVMSSKTP